MLESNKFSFVTDSKILEAFIKKVQNIMLKATDPAYFIAINKKSVCVVGLSGDTFASVTVPGATYTGSGAFGFDPTTLCGIIKGRSEMEFEFTGNECKFKQTKGKYDGHIVTLPITADQQSTAEMFLAAPKKSESVLSADTISKIRKALSCSAINDVYQGSTLLCYISLDKKGMLKVSSFDPQHFSMYQEEIEEKGVEFKAALPASYFTLIEGIAESHSAKFQIEVGKIKVDSKLFNITLPATQVDEKHFTTVETFMAAMPKPVFKCEFDIESATTVTENLFTLYNANTSFSISAKDSATALNVQFSTTHGTAKDVIKVIPSKIAKAFKAGVDPRLFKDILMLAKPLKKSDFTLNDKVFAISGKIDSATLFLSCARAS